MMMKRLLWGLAALIILLSVSACQHNAAAQRIPPGCQVGKKYIDVIGLQVNDKDQTQTSLSALIANGKPTLVDFWASWCGPCIREIPGLQALWQKYEGKINVVGIAIGDYVYDTEKAIRALGITYPVISSPEEAAKAYGIQSIPQIILIDGTGIIRANGLRGEAIEDALKIHIQ